MRKLMGRAGPLLIFAPPRPAGAVRGGRPAVEREPGPRSSPRAERPARPVRRGSVAEAWSER